MLGIELSIIQGLGVCVSRDNIGTVELHTQRCIVFSDQGVDIRVLRDKKLVIQMYHSL